MPKHTTYSYLWNRLLEPAYETLRGKKLPLLRKYLARTQFLPPDDLLDLQWEALSSLLIHAQKKVPFYTRYFAEQKIKPSDVIQSRDLSLLPVIDRGQLMAHPEEFVSQDPPPGSYKKSTGGSTGEPLWFWVSGLSDQWRNAMTRRGYAWAGAVNGRRVLHLWGVDIYPKKPLNRIKYELHRKLLRARTFSNFDLGEEKLRELTALIDSFRPKCLVCFTTSVEILADYALRKGWKPRLPLDSVVVGAEKLTGEQRDKIQRALDCKVFESYGSREFMLMAMECGHHQGMHVSAENLLIEVVQDGAPCAPGQSGEILVTDLHNYAQPFIRYKNGDLGSWAQGQCPCGRGLPRLASIEGRTLDIIRGLDGRPLTGAFFPHMLKEFRQVRRYQAEQVAHDRLIIRVVSDRPLTQDIRSEIIRLTNQVLPGLNIEVVSVDDIPKTAAGKTRVTIGLPPDQAGAADSPS